MALNVAEYNLGKGKIERMLVTGLCLIEISGLLPKCA